MSDDDDSDDERDLERKIKKLEREKEKLKEKRRSADKKQLEKLQREVLNRLDAEQLKESAGPSVISKKIRNDNYNLEQKEADSDDANVSDEEGNKLMSDSHKKSLQENRPFLVENMTPDEIFNAFVSNKIFTTNEISKIRESNGRETMNEELLDTLVRKPDRAFSIFVNALRKSLQGHLADLLQKPKKKMKRKAGDININVGVEDFQKDKRFHSDEPICSCEMIEKKIVLMAQSAFAHLRRRNDTPAAFEQFRKEVTGTNAAIKESFEILDAIKLFCKHDSGRQLENITYGSICFVIHCHTFEALQELWHMYTSGILLDRLQKGLVTKKLKQRYHVKNIMLRVRISEEEYQLCIRELIASDVNGAESTQVSSTGQQTTRRKIPERIAFKEIHQNITPPNPKKKHLSQRKKTQSRRKRNRSVKFNSAQDPYV